MNRKEFFATIVGAAVATKSIEPEKMVLYDDGYGKSWVTESQAAGTGAHTPKDYNIAEACERIRREAEELAGTNYQFGYINRAGGYINLLNK